MKPSNSNFIKAVKWKLNAKQATPVLWPFFEPVLPVFFVGFLQENTFYSSPLHLKSKQSIGINLITCKLSWIWFNFCFSIALVWLLKKHRTIIHSSTCTHIINTMCYVKMMPSLYPMSTFKYKNWFLKTTNNSWEQWHLTHDYINFFYYQLLNYINIDTE